MPRIAGVNIVGVLVASFVFYFVGFIFFGVVYERAWLLEILSPLSYEGKTMQIDQSSTELLRAEMKKAFPDANQALSLGLGYLNALGTCIILAFVLRQLTSEAPGFLANLAWTLAIVAGFVVTSVAYDHIYAMQSMALFWMNFWHLVCAYAAAAMVLTVIE